MAQTAFDRRIGLFPPVGMRIATYSVRKPSFEQIMQRKAWKQPRGVTLVELMIVVALIGILATVSGPSVFSALSRIQSDGVARSIASTYAYARNQAMSRGEPVWVTIDTGASATDRGGVLVQRYVSSNDAPVRSCREFAAGNMDTVRSLDMDTQSGQQILRGSGPAINTICFAPDGRALTQTGMPLTPDNTNCIGDVYNVWLSNSTMPAPDATMKNCAATKEARLTQRDKREIAHYYRISVPFHGNVKVD